MTAKKKPAKTDVPKSDVEVIDSDAAEAEADGAETVAVEWDGHDYEILTDRREWNVEAMVAVEEGKMNIFLKHILGPAQWRRYTMTRPSAGDADEFTSKIITQGLGANQGE